VPRSVTEQGAPRAPLGEIRAPGEAPLSIVTDFCFMRPLPWADQLLQRNDPGLRSPRAPLRSPGGKYTMLRPIVLALACAAGCLLADRAQAQDRAYTRPGGNAVASRDWNRFYHYPYVYYPQNFWGNDYYRSSGDMYYRYPPEMQIPVYNKKWHNSYPENRRFHSGHHFMLDVF
jgi:hypothetical protein